MEKKKYNTLRNEKNDTDFFLELHKLLNPENMKQILSVKSKKLDNIVKLKEIYSFTYSPTNYETEISDEQRKKMMSKITAQKAKELCVFINSLPIKINGKRRQNLLVNEKQIDKIRNIAQIKKIDGQFRKTNLKNYKEKHKLGISLTNTTKKNTKEDVEILQKLEKKRADLSKSEIPSESFQNVKDINEFVKRKPNEEKPSFEKKEKPKFVSQIDKIKKSKISVNIFPFHEKDKIDIKKTEKEAIVNLTQIRKTENMDIKETMKDDPNDKNKFIKDLEVDRKVYDDKGEKVSEEIIYSSKHPDKVGKKVDLNTEKDKKNINKNKKENK